MNKTSIDARGQVCPRPLIMTKGALRGLAVGQEMTVLVDNETSKENVCRFLEDVGAETSCTETEGVFTIRVKKLRHVEAQSEVEVDSYCQPSATKTHAIVIKNDKMGFGAEELGNILIKALINTIGDASPLPDSIVFYNNGIHLAVEGSPVIDALRELESHGVKILVCGTCLDYYGKKQQLQVGTVSNMHDILQTLTTAGHLIEP